MKTVNEKVSLSLYDVWDTFLFFVVRMPYLCSNIPRKTFYDSLGAEILKIVRVTADLEKFKLRSKIRKQGDSKSRVKFIKINKLSRQNFQFFRSFSPACLDFLECF